MRVAQAAVKSKKKAQKLHNFFLHISSSYAKIFGGNTREIPRSGSKAKDGEKREKY